MRVRADEHIVEAVSASQQDHDDQRHYHPIYRRVSGNPPPFHLTAHHISHVTSDLGLKKETHEEK